MKLLAIMAVGVFAAGNLMADEVSDLEFRVSELESRLEGGTSRHWTEPKQSPENAEKVWQEKMKEFSENLGREINEKLGRMK